MRPWMEAFWVYVIPPVEIIDVGGG